MQSVVHMIIVHFQFKSAVVGLAEAWVVDALFLLVAAALVTSVCPSWEVMGLVEGACGVTLPAIHCHRGVINAARQTVFILALNSDDTCRFDFLIFIWCKKIRDS